MLMLPELPEEVDQIICMGVFGSHLYGLNTPTSDMDYKGVYIPTEKSVFLNSYPHTIVRSTGAVDSKNTHDDVDTDIYSLLTFVKDACKGETCAIDMLHMENTEVDGLGGYIWNELVSERDKFYSKNMKALLGYARKQAAKYGIKGSRLQFLEHTLNFLNNFDNQLHMGSVWNGLPVGEFATKISPDCGNLNDYWWICCEKKFSATTPLYLVVDSLQKMYDGYGHRAQQAKNNEGVDWKAVSHAFRACYQMRDIYKYGDFEYPLKETDFIKAIKLGNLDFTKDIQPELEHLIEEVNKLAEKSSFPDKVDVDYWDTWLYNTLKSYYR